MQKIGLFLKNEALRMAGQTWNPKSTYQTQSRPAHLVVHPPCSDIHFMLIVEAPA